MMDENPVNILAAKIEAVNAIDRSYFACVSQFDIKKSEIFIKTMQKLNTF